MSIRPIEPGCLAVVHSLRVHTQYNGLGVRVEGLVRRGDRHVDEAGNETVFIDSEGWLCARSDWAGCVPFDASNLLRIDDHGEDADDYEVIREEWGITA